MTQAHQANSANTKSQNSSTKTLTSAMERALRALAQPGAYGVEAEGGVQGTVAIVASRRSVSVRVASASKAVVARLCAEDLAIWEGAKGARQRLTLTSAGRAKVARLDASADLDPFRAQHLPVMAQEIRDGGETIRVRVDMNESPLAWLAARRGTTGQPLVDKTCLDAGERLRSEMTKAQMLPKVTANWSPNAACGNSGIGNLNPSEQSLAARQRMTLALRAVGPDFADLLIDICGFLKGLEQIEQERHWPARSGKVVLGLALARLCDHYGMTRQAIGPARSLGLRHWGSEDFKPLRT